MAVGPFATSLNRQATRRPTVSVTQSPVPFDPNCLETRNWSILLEVAIPRVPRESVSRRLSPQSVCIRPFLSNHHQRTVKCNRQRKTTHRDRIIYTGCNRQPSSFFRHHQRRRHGHGSNSKLIKLACQTTCWRGVGSSWWAHEIPVFVGEGSALEWSRNSFFYWCLLENSGV